MPIRTVVSCESKKCNESAVLDQTKYKTFTEDNVILIFTVWHTFAKNA